MSILLLQKTIFSSLLVNRKSPKGNNSLHHLRVSKKFKKQFSPLDNLLKSILGDLEGPSGRSTDSTDGLKTSIYYMEHNRQTWRETTTEHVRTNTKGQSTRLNDYLPFLFQNKYSFCALALLSKTFCRHFLRLTVPGFVWRSNVMGSGSQMGASVFYQWVV